MRLNILLAFLAAFVAAVQAQNALEALAERMPKCAVCCPFEKPEINPISDMFV
jgi:hypothetical protein